MLRIVIVLCIAAGLVLSVLQSAGASDLCCIGKTEKDVRGVCVVTGFQEGRICMEETSDGKSKACRGLSGCYELKDLGNAGVGSHVIVTGWRAGDQKCYNGPNCGKVIVVGGSAARQPVQDTVSLPPPPLPEGGQAQQQPSTASLPPPTQQPQPQTQPPAQQEPQQPVTQTIDSTLDIFKKVKDLFK